MFVGSSIDRHTSPSLVARLVPALPHLPRLLLVTAPPPVPRLGHLVAGPGLLPLAAADPGVVLLHTLSDARVGGFPFRHLAVHRIFISVLLATL